LTGPGFTSGTLPDVGGAAIATTGALLDLSEVFGVTADGVGGAPVIGVCVTSVDELGVTNDPAPVVVVLPDPVTVVTPFDVTAFEGATSDGLIGAATTIGFAMGATACPAAAALGL
jgi:hypothetical protein